MSDAQRHVHLDRELVDLLAGDADPDRRRALLDQVHGCDVCRARADELTAAMADVVTAAPAVTPPLGFETRVAARLAEAAATLTPTSSPARRRPWWLAAAAVILVVAAGALAFTVSRPRDSGAGEVLALVRTGTDDTVGTVSFAEAADGPVMVVALVEAPADIAYRCRMRMTDGTVVDSPVWLATARGAWVLDVPGTIDDIERVEIVADATGTVWSSAQL